MADLAVWQRTIVDPAGNTVPNAEVEVRHSDSSALADIYLDREGAQAAPNPITADGNGFVRFYAPGGAYRVEAYGGGATAVWDFVAVGRLAEHDAIGADQFDDDEGEHEAIRDKLDLASGAEVKVVAEAAEAAVDLASEPGEIPSEFYSNADQAVFAFVNEQGDTIAAFDQDGRWHAWQPADAEFSRSGMDLAFAYTDEDGQVLWGIESSGHFWGRETRHEFPGTQDEDPALAFAYTDEDSRVLWGVEESGHFWSRQTRNEFLDTQNKDIAFAYADEDGRVLWGVESSGHFWSRETRYEFSDAQNKGIAFAYTDEDGRVLLGFDEHGNLVAQGNEPPDVDDDTAIPLLPYLDGTALHAVGADDVVAADLGSYTALSTAPGNQNSVRAVLDWPAIGATRSVSAGNGLLVPDADNVLHIVIGLGQSLMVGSSSASSLVSTEAEFPEDVLMFDAGPHSDVRMGLTTQGGDNDVLDPADLVGFLPLVAKAGQGGGSRGETPMEGFANALEREARRLGIRYRMLNFTAAQGGTGYNDLKKGTQIYANMIAAVTKAVELAADEGWQVIVDGCIVRHGESNAGNSSYGDYLLEWQEDVDADIRGITGQQAPVHFLIAQPSSFGGDDTQAAPLMVDIHNSSPFHHVSGPDYGYMDLYYSDALHGTGPFYYINGEYLARAWAQALWSSRGKSSITQITAAERNGTTVTLTYEVPDPPLQIDTTTVSERDNKGFRYRDSNGEIEVVDVEVTHEGISTGGIGTIKLTLGSTPSGNGEQVLYAMSGKEVSGDIATLARGNVRDSAQRTSTYDGRRLYNWGVHQRIDVEIQ